MDYGGLGKFEPHFAGKADPCYFLESYPTHMKMFLDIASVITYSLTQTLFELNWPIASTLYSIVNSLFRFLQRWNCDSNLKHMSTLL